MILQMVLGFLQSNAGQALEASAVNSLTYLVEAAIKHQAETMVPAVAAPAS